MVLIGNVLYVFPTLVI